MAGSRKPNIEPRNLLLHCRHRVVHSRTQSPLQACQGQGLWSCWPRSSHAQIVCALAASGAAGNARGCGIAAIHARHSTGQRTTSPAALTQQLEPAAAGKSQMQGAGWRSTCATTAASLAGFGNAKAAVCTSIAQGSARSQTGLPTGHWSAASTGLLLQCEQFHSAEGHFLMYLSLPLLSNGFFPTEG